MKMQKLKQQIGRAKPVDGQAAEDIYTYIDENITPHIMGQDSPPPSLLIYMAQRITEPELMCDEIPQLLNLLVNIEAVRQRAVVQAHEVLQLQQQFLESRKPGVRMLKKPDEKRLRGIADEDTDRAMRLVLHVEVVLNLCRLHICYLWSSPKFYLVLKFMKRYFPANYVQEGDAFADEHWQSLLHYGLTREERERVFAFGEEMKRFITTVDAWSLERMAYFKNLGLSEEEIFGGNEFVSFPRDFNAKFRNTADEKMMTDALKEYLNEVQRMVNILEKLFPSAQLRAESAAAELLAREAETEESETQ